MITTLIVVTQPSLAQAITTARDQIIGACIGAIVGGIGIVVIERCADPMTVFSAELLPLAAQRQFLNVGKGRDAPIGNPAGSCVDQSVE